MEPFGTPLAIANQGFTTSGEFSIVPVIIVVTTIVVSAIVIYQLQRTIHEKVEAAIQANLNA